MTRRSSVQLDGWLWPSGVPAPKLVDETQAGVATVRYPRPDPAFAHALASALRKAQRRLEPMSPDTLLAGGVWGRD